MYSENPVLVTVGNVGLFVPSIAQALDWWGPNRLFYDQASMFSQLDVTAAASKNLFSWQCFKGLFVVPLFTQGALY